MHDSICQNPEHLLENLVNTCPLCVCRFFRHRSRLVRHFQAKHLNHSATTAQHTILLCKLNCYNKYQSLAGHYHCPIPSCPITNRKSDRLLHHYNKHLATLCEGTDPALPDAVTETSESSQYILVNSEKDVCVTYSPPHSNNCSNMPSQESVQMAMTQGNCEITGSTDGEHGYSPHERKLLVEEILLKSETTGTQTFSRGVRTNLRPRVPSRPIATSGLETCWQMENQEAQSIPTAPITPEPVWVEIKEEIEDQECLLPSENILKAPSTECINGQSQSTHTSQSSKIELADIKQEEEELLEICLRIKQEQECPLSSESISSFVSQEWSNGQLQATHSSLLNLADIKQEELVDYIEIKQEKLEGPLSSESISSFVSQECTNGQSQSTHSSILSSKIEWTDIKLEELEDYIEIKQEVQECPL